MPREDLHELLKIEIRFPLPSLGAWFVMSAGHVRLEEVLTAVLFEKKPEPHQAKDEEASRQDERTHDAAAGAGLVARLVHHRYGGDSEERRERAKRQNLQPLPVYRPHVVVTARG